MVGYANSSFVGRKDAIAISLSTPLPGPDPDGIIGTFSWTPPAAGPSAVGSQILASPSPGLSTIPGALISHSHASPGSPAATATATPYVPGSSQRLSLPTALSSATTLAAIALPVLSTVLQESPLATTMPVAESGVGAIVVITTTVAAHLGTTAAASRPTPAGPQYSRHPYWTPSFTAFVVMVSLLVGCISLTIVWFLWRMNRNEPDFDDMEEGVKSPRLPGAVAAGQRLEGGRPWSIISSSSSEVYGSEPGAGRGIGRSTTASSGNPAPRGSAIDAGDRGSSSAGASSSYLSAVEYNELDSESICSSSSSENGGPHSPISVLAPLSFGPGQMLINSDNTTPTIAASAINASTAESSRVRENRALGEPDCLVSSCRHPLSGDGTVGPVLVLGHREAGGPGCGSTGPEGCVGRHSVPQVTGSLQERLLGKYPARWG